MTEGSENASPSADVARSDELAARIATIESRLDQIDAALNTSGLSDFLQKQQAAHEEHKTLLAKLKREQDSLGIQTSSRKADEHEEGQPILNALLNLGFIFFILLCLAAYIHRPWPWYEQEFKRGSHLANQTIVKASFVPPSYWSAVIDYD